MSVQHKQLSSLALPTAPPDVRPSISLHAQRRVFQAVLLISDSLMIALAFSIAYWLRFDISITVSPEIVPPPGFYMLLTITLIPVWLALFALFRLYDFHYLLGGTSEYSRVFNACTFGIVVVIVSAFVAPSLIIARGWLLSAWLLSALMTCAARFSLRRVVYALRERGYYLTPAAIVGTNEEARAIAEQLQGWQRSGIHLMGFVNADGSTPRDEHELLGLPALGTLDQIPGVVQRYGIEEFIVATTAVDRTSLLHVFEQIDAMRDVELRLSSGLFEIFTTGVQVKTLGSVPLMSLNKLRLDPVENTLKTLLDYSVALVTVFVLLPLLAVIAVLIRLDSPGPILHRRRVLGVRRREFDAFKFRTMYVNGDDILDENPDLLEEYRVNEKLKDDPRVTPIGKWLRRYSIDELPQLLNVLLGQMSLVGPRIITPEEAERYGRYRSNLLTVKPGITGLWQVSGRSDLTYEERVRLDMHYIRTYTIWQDLHILFVQTPPAVLNARGAY